MASKKDEAKVKFTAETEEFNAEIKKSEQQMKEYRSELRLNSEMMKTVGENAELLQQKQDILTKEYEASEAKIQALTGKLEAAASIWGESSEEVSKYRIQLNNARTAQEKIRQEIDKATEASKDFEQRMSQAASEADGFGQETEQASEDTQDLAENLGDSARAAEDAGEGFTIAKGALADLAADGIAAASEALKDFIKDTGTASSSFEAMTGASKAEMAEFNAEMEDLYKKGYGDSLNDIGDAMAYVKQTMNDLDPEIISDISENAMALDDIFGIDIQESIRAVDTLMTTMGLDADEAFDYIAKGAQNGLNYSGELADNIAEYGPLWEQAGFSAEEMFTILQNGVDSGAYNLDKINDFVKEFTISLSDGRIEENLESFSDETQRLFKEWKDGKRTSKDVFRSVINDLSNAQDQQEALTTASNVWSSLGEDNAMNIITSLNNVNDTYEDVQGTMESIKDIKYDNIVEQYKTLGRTVVTDLVTPLAEKALPALEDFVDFATENLDDIIPLAQGVGTAFGTIFVLDKVQDFAGALTNLTNPIGLVTTAIGFLAGGVVALNSAYEASIDETYGLTEEQKLFNEQIHAGYEEYMSMIEARDAEIEGIMAEYNYLEQLKTELDSLVDANGRVKTGYEDRVRFILNELSEATGIQMEYIDGEIQGYQDLVSEIDTVIEKKRAEAVLGAYEESYTEAIRERENATAAYTEAVNNNREAQEKLAEANANVSDISDKLSTITNLNSTEYRKLSIELAKANDEQKKAQETFDETSDTLAETEEKFVGYNTTIKNYEGLQSAILSGEADDIEAALQRSVNAFITAETGTRATLEQQVEDMEQNYISMKQAVEDGVPGVTQEMVDGAEEMYKLSLKELKKLGPDMSKVTDDNMRQMIETMSSYDGEMVDSVDMLNMVGVDAWIGHYKEWKQAGSGSTTEVGQGMRQKKPDVDKATTDIANGALTILNNADFVSPGKKAIQDNASGMTSQKGMTDSAAKNIADSANANLGSANTGKTGQDKVTQYRDGALSAQPNVDSAAGDIAASMNANLGSADTYGTGNSEGLGMYAGLYAARGAINGGAADIAASMNANLGSADTWSTGGNDTVQYGLGMASKSSTAESMAKGIANSAKGALGSVDTTPVGRDTGQGFINGLTAMKQAAYNAAYGLAQRANAGLRAGTDSHSPSRIARSIGDDYTTGFSLGISDDAENVYDITKGLGENASEGLMQGMNYGNILDDARKTIRDFSSFSRQHDNVSIQYDGLFNLRQIEDIIAKYSKKEYSFTLNRRELIRAMEE